MTDMRHLAMEIDDAMNHFRRASREIFNNYFKRDDLESCDVSVFSERLYELNNLLFEMLVTDCPRLEKVPYGQAQPRIVVTPVSNIFAPVLINREIDSGYWDYPLFELPGESVLLFSSYFDWDDINFCDNQYVRARIKSCNAHPEVVGRDVLIEALNVRFSLI